MRKNGNIYEYIATYVDDLAICMKVPTEVTNSLQEKYGYELKGVGPITYHLGSDYKRDPNGTFHTSAESYINKMVESCQVSKSVGVTLENTGRMDCGSLCDTIQSTIR